MRPSSRTQILDAAIRVAERDGITALTLDSAAGEAGVTRAGLLYHFRNRDDLMLAIHQHLVEIWEQDLLAELGKPWAEATATERSTAYVQEGTRGRSRPAELIFMVHAAAHPAYSEVWEQLLRRWAPEADAADSAAVDLFLARMAADGLWLHQATSPTPLDDGTREVLRDRITALATGRARRREK
ncbi:TetR family transcriptional regulator [Saccharopolyspora sp. HNM0983]|uniref:TetR family transcriptional regulator n=1 Tax=Saccharopolyspora montiporae TaxID=2781240 RepID=A0A929G0I1_9PSEU|nr:TetR family transcriptional regulator [Saccharopolyspora sp. HNM0983]MBE9373628.1 TetR family transcriptional regulator [Saccharopolyspora sp. HNM0983]